MQRIGTFLAVAGFLLVSAADADAFPITYSVTGRYALAAGSDALGLHGRTLKFNYVFESTDAFTQGTVTGGFTGRFTPRKVTMTLVGTRADGTYVAASPRPVTVIDFKPGATPDEIQLFTQTFGPSIGPGRETISVTTALEFANSFLPGTLVNGLPLFDASDILSISSTIRTFTSIGTPNATYTFVSGGAFSDPAPQTQGVIPEPSSFVLLASGVLGLACIGWRRKKCGPH